MSDSSPGKRVRQFRDHFGLSQAAFGKAINMSRGNISKIESDSVEPSNGFLYSAMFRFKANPDWILTGKGTMFITSADYLRKGIELFGPDEISEGLAEVLEDPRYAKFYSLAKAGDLVGNDIDEELAAYLRYILKNWREGERNRHWVMRQLELAFREVKEKDK